MKAPPPSALRGRGRGRTLALTLLAASGFGVVVAALLILTARYFYGRELAVRLQLNNWSPARHTGSPGGVRVLFLGDSRAEQWPALPADRFQTINAGVGGETTAQVLLRTRRLLAEEHPAVVIIQAGINDLKAIGVLPRSAPTIQAQCLSNLVAMVRECQDQGAGVVVTLIFPPGPVDWQRRLFWSPRIAPAVQEINNALSRQFAPKSGVVILDTVNLLSPPPEGGPPQEYYEDTLHLRPAAYMNLQAALLPLLDKVLGTRREDPLNSNNPAGR